MKRTKRLRIILIISALSLCLASCAQGQVNENRLPGGQGGREPTGGGTDPTAANTGQYSQGGSAAPSDEVPENWDPNDPMEFEKYVDVEDSTFNDTRRREGGGTVLFTVTSAGLYDSLADAGISEESYAASGESRYDHYLKIGMTVKNVDVPDTGEEYNANNFRLMGHVSFWYVGAVWFSLGGQADDEARAYFHFYLPPAGETMEITVAFGLTDSDLAAFRASDGIWLTYDIPTLQRLKLEGLL